MQLFVKSIKVLLYLIIISAVTTMILLPQQELTHNSDFWTGVLVYCLIIALVGSIILAILYLIYWFRNKSSNLILASSTMQILFG